MLYIVKKGEKNFTKRLVRTIVLAQNFHTNSIVMGSLNAPFFLNQYYA